MLSMNAKGFGLRATLGAVALGLGLAGAVSVSAPAKADMAAITAGMARGSPSAMAIRTITRRRGSIIRRLITLRRSMATPTVAA